MTDNVVHASYEDTAKKFVYSEKYVSVNLKLYFLVNIYKG